MTWAQAVAAAREAMKALLEQRLLTLFGWTLVSNSSSMGDQDYVQGEDGGTSQRPVQRIEPWGLRNRPPAKMRALWLRIGTSNVVFLGIRPSEAYGPIDLGDGETALYSSAEGCVLKLDADGVIHIGQNGGLGTSDGVVHGSGIDPFSRLTYEQLGNACDNVRAKKD